MQLVFPLHFTVEPNLLAALQ